ncbi:DUF2207 domain-containing protein [Halobacillus halophilus]|uniref:DUF2207 domain-containing protein n=1 Tax=Halobacillus halophilus TaxID=1570 RepID=UPI0013829713|nr:DUF2207 domain-containing protein [Halobacillus halophilus]MYL30137.1 DUF2207 domain-containing protein [Halobacillus halophilus]
MMKKLIGWMLALLVLFIPLQTSAVELTIEETNINADLKKNGDVHVTEAHTYTFHEDFNGITRTLLPKEGTTITNVQAEEKGQELRIEQEDHTYKVFRDGNDETITINLSYTIQDGVEVFTDAAQFYYAFFDESNESDYEQMSITVAPPEKAEVSAAYGEDSAYQTETIQEDGVVTFNMGYVNSGTNGNIRVAYPADVFPEAEASDTAILSSIQNQKQELDETVAARQEAVNNWKSSAPYLITVTAAAAVLLLGTGLINRSAVRQETQRQKVGNGFFPTEEMSLPALIYFTNHGQLTHSAVTASLLHMIDKGSIRQHSEEEFELVSRETDAPHEKQLITWLFDDIAEGNLLHINDLETYAEKEKNQERYRLAFQKWKEIVRWEYQSLKLRKEKTWQRWTALGMTFVSLTLTIIFGYYTLIPSMSAMIVFSLFFIIFSAGYRPLTARGYRIRVHTEPYKTGRLQNVENGDGVPALLYQIGFGKQKWQTGDPAFSSPNQAAFFLILAANLDSGFERADTHTAVSAASSSGTSGGGAGVGGGGGGSGGF